MKQIDAVLEKLHENVKYAKAKIWQNRIYLDGVAGRDITAYVSFDDPYSDNYNSLFDGCSLKVYTSVRSQPPQWCDNRRKLTMHNIAEDFFEMGILPEAPCEDWQDIIL